MSRNKTKYITYILLCLLIVLLNINLSNGCERNVHLQVNKVEIENEHLPKYKIAKETYIDDPLTFVLFISVSPRHFNEQDMVLLTKKLKRDFSNNSRLEVNIFDNLKSARNFLRLYFLVNRKKALNLVRGYYIFDKVSGLEYVSFVPNISKPKERTKIVFEKGKDNEE